MGDKDDEGYMTGEGMFRRNSRENGQYHSNWLNMMMPRLYLAKNLLREDGVIFVSIDDNEVHNLRLLMNEIFGEENFVANIVWEKRYGRSNDAQLMSTVCEHILLYRRTETVFRLREVRNSDEKGYSNPDNDPRGVWTSVSFVSQRTRDERPNLSYPLTNPFTKKTFTHPTNSWKYNEEKYKEMLADNRFYWGKNKDQDFPRIKRFLSELDEGMVPVNLWKFSDTGTTDQGTKEVIELIGKNIFTYPKPIKLISRMLQMGSDRDSIILDFFAGSGTTAHAVMQLNKEDGGNRKFICVQMPEPCEEKSEAYKAGYNTIADIAKERIRRVGKKIQSEIAEENRKNKEKLDFDQSREEVKLDTGFKVFKLSESNFKQWRQPRHHNAEELKEQLKLFIDPVAENAVVENMVYELLLKSGKDLNSQTENNDGYYLVNGNELAFILEKVNEQIILEVLSKYPKKVIALDRIFNGNDQLKTNTALQMKDAGVEFKTI